MKEGVLMIIHIYPQRRLCTAKVSPYLYPMRGFKNLSAIWVFLNKIFNFVNIG